MKVAVLTSPNQWFVPYAEQLVDELNEGRLFLDHKDVSEDYKVLFILSYHQIIPIEYLNLREYNIVIHASALPQGKGWSPMFWQILEGKNEITFSMFEAGEGIDDGAIYMQKTLAVNGYELNEELRFKQASFTIHMCLDFLRYFEKYKVPVKQSGDESFYPKRTSKGSEIDVDQTIREQFNLLRIVNNDSYPAFFTMGERKYKLTIEEIKE